MRYVQINQRSLKKLLLRTHNEILLLVFNIKHKHPLLLQIQIQTILKPLKVHLLLKLLQFPFQIVLLWYHVIRYHCKFWQKLSELNLIFTVNQIYLKSLHLKILQLLVTFDFKTLQPYHFPQFIGTQRNIPMYNPFTDYINPCQSFSNIRNQLLLLCQELLWFSRLLLLLSHWLVLTINLSKPTLNANLNASAISSQALYQPQTAPNIGPSACLPSSSSVLTVIPINLTPLITQNYFVFFVGQFKNLTVVILRKNMYIKLMLTWFFFGRITSRSCSLKSMARKKMAEIQSALSRIASSWFLWLPEKYQNDWSASYILSKSNYHHRKLRITQKLNLRLWSWKLTIFSFESSTIRWGRVVYWFWYNF